MRGWRCGLGATRSALATTVLVVGGLLPVKCLLRKRAGAVGALRRVLWERGHDQDALGRLLGGLGGSLEAATSGGGGGAARDRWERDVQARAAAAAGLPPSFPGASDARSDWRNPAAAVAAVDVRTLLSACSRSSALLSPLHLSIARFFHTATAALRIDLSRFGST